MMNIEDNNKDGKKKIEITPLPYFSIEVGGKIIDVTPHTPPKFDVGDPKALLYVINHTSLRHQLRHHTSSHVINYVITRLRYIITAYHQLRHHY